MSRITIPKSPSRAARGFTLIELLIVIAILGVLAAVLVPQLTSANHQANAVATEADMQSLATSGIGNFERAWGTMPPDDLSATAAYKAAWKPDNGRNTGIESLVCFLSQSSRDGLDLDPMTDHMTNGDGDEHGIEIPRLKTKERKEIADHWKTPLAYFTKFGMQKAQQVQSSTDTEAMQVKAKRRPDGRPYGEDKFQLLSAGRDTIFGTDDDLYWPKN
jgi:prepilin-type N-terminal cleavage/methylation domain-containing protein